MTRMLSLRAAADTSGLPYEWLLAAVEDGRIPHINVAAQTATRNAYRIDPADLDAFVAASKVVGTR